MSSARCHCSDDANGGAARHCSSSHVVIIILHSSTSASLQCALQYAVLDIKQLLGMQCSLDSGPRED